MLRNRSTLFTVLALAVVFVSAPVQVRSQTPGDWTLVAPTGEGFSVRMPGKPEAENSTYPINGEHYRSHMYTFADPATRQFYLVVMQEFPKVVEALKPAERMEHFMTGFVSGFKESLAASMGGTPTVDMKLERELNLKGHGGREYSVAINQSKGLLRAYDGVSRMYMLLTLGGDEKNAAVNRFLSSFEIQAAPAPVPQQVETKPAASNAP